MREQRYFASDSEAGSERERLALLEAARDPKTFELIGRFGIREGCQCLEVGAGGGSVVRGLAERVGPTGRVVAVDLDTRFLETLKLSNVEVRQQNIMTDPLEEGVFDLVHCRALLLHLPDPRRALKRMSASLRPGGWLVVEDADFTPFGSALPEHPRAEAFDRVMRAGLELLRSSGRMDPFLGRRLPGMVAELGLVDLGHEGSTRVQQGKSPDAMFWKQSIERVLEMPNSPRLASEEEIKAATSALEDPTFTFVGSILFAAWGRRPA